MPELTFLVRWPDGTEASCYSPSLVVHDFLDVGRTYPVTEFVERSSAALDLASERVRAKFGFVCTSAMQQKSEIRETAAGFAFGDVEILSMDPALPTVTRPAPTPSPSGSLG